MVDSLKTIGTAQLFFKHYKAVCFVTIKQIFIIFKLLFKFKLFIQKKKKKNRHLLFKKSIEKENYANQISQFQKKS